MTCLKQGIKAVKLTSVMRAFPGVYISKMKQKHNYQMYFQNDNMCRTLAPAQNKMINLVMHKTNCAMSIQREDGHRAIVSFNDLAISILNVTFCTSFAQF